MAGWCTWAHKPRTEEGFRPTLAHAQQAQHICAGFFARAGFRAVSEMGKAGTVLEASAALFCYCGAVAEAFAMSG